jgi:hypothetical protein
MILLLLTVHGFSQDISPDLSPIKMDSLYREDQFYFGFTLNSLQKKPAGLNQSKFSSGFSAGFLRDMPINKNRTVAFASGLGFSYNAYNQNIKISGSNKTPVYTIIESNVSYSKNRFTQFLVEVPIEFRWRTSTYDSHKFWRIYGGLKLGYLLYDRSVYLDSQDKIVITANKDFDKFRYGAYVSSGYNTFNVYAYYGLNPLFKSAKLNNQSLDMNVMNIGVIFYIL